MEELVSEIQTQLTAVQAALEGNTQSGLRSFNGLPNEGINKWLSCLETLAKFHNWSQAKRLNALPLSLGGPANAWYDTMPPKLLVISEPNTVMNAHNSASTNDNAGFLKRG